MLLWGHMAWSSHDDTLNREEHKHHSSSVEISSNEFDNLEGGTNPVASAHSDKNISDADSSFITCIRKVVTNPVFLTCAVSAAFLTAGIVMIVDAQDSVSYEKTKGTCYDDDYDDDFYGDRNYHEHEHSCTKESCVGKGCVQQGFGIAFAIIGALIPVYACVVANDIRIPGFHHRRHNHNKRSGY